MCELQPVDGDCVMAAVDIEYEVLVALLDNAERTRVKLGWRPPVAVLANIGPYRAGEA